MSNQDNVYDGVNKCEPSKETLKIDPSEIQKLLYENAETGYIHPTHQEDMLRYYYLKEGDMRAVDEAVRTMNADMQGTLSKDPIRNLKYLFVVTVGLAARFVVEAGVPLEEAYSVSDLYIQKMDLLETGEEISRCLAECYTTYVETVRKYKKSEQYSKPVMICLNYIASHFTEKITLEELGKEAYLHPNYLSALFKKETGESLREYIMRNRIDVAKSLLARTDYSYIQISNSLAFHSQSHFTKVFRERTGYTPKQYRLKFYDTNITKQVASET